MRRRIVSALLCLLLLGCAPAAQTPPAEDGAPSAAERMDVRYARQFSVDYSPDGSALLTVGGTERYRLLPKDAPEPEEEEAGVTVIRVPVHRAYLASSSAADLFLQMDALSAIRFTSTDKESWRLPELRQALDAEELSYAGKYSAPDFEALLAGECDLALENTMILHSPQIREKLESLGIPVLVERSSYESHPLGRVEWIKVYGLLTGRAAEAEAFFEAQTQALERLEGAEKSGKTVAFFHINSNGAAVVRKSGDYVAKMIELAGGTYVFSDLTDDNALSTMNLQMETFYAAAREADVLIYNSTIDGELSTLAQLLDKSPLLADFRAVRTGDVWCTEQSMFQKTSAAEAMIEDFHTVLTGGAEPLRFLHKLT